MQDRVRPSRRAGTALAYAMLCVVMALWAGNSIVGRAVRDTIPPFTLAFARWAGALCLVGPFAAKRVAADGATLRRHWRIVLLLGLVGVAAFNGFLYSGLRLTTATNGLLLQAMVPALVLLSGALLGQGRAPRAQLAGVCLSTFGVALVVFRADPSAVATLRLNAGDALVLCAGLAWALYTVLLPRRPAVHPLAFLAVTFAIGALAMLPLAAGEWQRARIAWTPAVVGAFAYVAIFPSCIAYFLYNEAVSTLGAGPAGQTMSLMPLFGAGLASLVLGEPLHAWHLAGMAFICAGIGLTVRGLARVSADRRALRHPRP
jgi:drug/metabolite transporter (DMT)-like permease